MVDKKKKGGLAKRYQASYDNKGSGSKSGVMNYKKLDRDVEFFSPKEGRNRINIIPYTIKTKNHPLVKSGEFEIGDKDYVMDIFVHRGVGPSEASVLCLKETYGKPCPICEQAALLRKKGNEDEAAALKPSRRVFYNVQDCKNSDKLMVFEASHYLFEKELIDEARDDDDGGFVDFADEEKGKEIKFRCSKVQKAGYEFNEFKSFSFEERDEGIPDDLLESAISFDEIMNVPTYEEAEKILFGEDDDDEEETPKSKKVEDEDSDEEEPKKKPSRKVEQEDDDEDDDDEPVKKLSKKRPVEDDDDDDDDEEETPKSKKSSKKDCDGDCGKCPFGHKFGVDTDDFDDCDDCDVWDKCINGGKK